MQVKVFDPNTPEAPVTCTGTIFIQRNLNSPVFTEDIYRVTISEYHPLLEPVLNLTAVDADGVRMTLANMNFSRALIVFVDYYFFFAFNSHLGLVAQHVS